MFTTRRFWLVLLIILFIMECWLNMFVYKYVARNKLNRMDCITLERWENNETILYYEYPLINESEISMDYTNFNSSYYWFTSMKHLFKNIGEEEYPVYPKDTPVCVLDKSILGPININKRFKRFETVKEENPEVKEGGFYAPAHCRSAHQVAIIIPLRKSKVNLAILLSHLLPLLKKQQLEYRIFVVEQYGREKFNKGTLNNIAFLETQRFGNWSCLIFHDVDLVPKDERILYSCPKHPTFMAARIDYWNGTTLYKGGVISVTPEQYRNVNGYSNFFWGLSGEDEDFNYRLESKNYTVLRYNETISQYFSLPRARNDDLGSTRETLIRAVKFRFETEGLITTKYNLLRVSKENLYTHLLADVNPTRINLNGENLIQQSLDISGK